MKHFRLFTHSEFVGTILIVLIIIGIQSFRIWVLPLVKPKPEIDTLLLADAIKNFELKKDSLHKLANERSYDKVIPQYSISDSFNFDINSITEDSLSSLGMKKFLAKRLIDFREMKNGFDSIAQVLQTYGLSSDDSQFILNHGKVYIDTTNERSDEKKEYHYQNKYKKKFEKPKTWQKDYNVIVNLNSKNKDSLQYLNGVSPFYAKLIVEHNEKLGGYHSVWQLLDLWEVDTTMILNLQKQVKIAPNISQIKINEADEKVLSYHPYIDYKLAQRIVKYRIQHGKYKNISHLREVYGITNEWINKIEPYLNFE